HTIDEGERALQRILEALSAPFALGAATVTVSASVGAAFFPSDGTDPDTLLRHADQAMYSAKQEGRNRYHLFDSEHNRRAQTHRELLERIGQGLVAGEFCLYYQPKVDMRCGKVIGAEALIRWRHPERGILAPGAFIAVVENSDLAPAVGDWVLGTAMKQMAVWAAEGLTLPVSVNISARHLQQPDFAARVQALLAHHSSIQPEWLELEILETTALDEIEQFSRIIADCRQLGVRFALDDFGTGYCSLTYLRHLPAQILKIDQSFIRNMLDNPDDLAIVRGVIGLSSAFKRDIIAEGVETIEHGVLLLQLGCDYAQGYAIARPMPAEEVPGWVCAWRNPEEWNGSRRHSR
ncbi:MAG: bifunctional diguanylate cyclase/phosphodiesterase, partial [Candidatus Contendobacter sp.]|nr:bifunctional diguanylate cyclase/phosphodiesterase [Candidatus Contendobacter sp.]